MLGGFRPSWTAPHAFHPPQRPRAGRDGRKPNQPARAGGFFRSSGFQIRDAVPGGVRVISDHVGDDCNQTAWPVLAATVTWTDELTAYSTLALAVLTALLAVAAVVAAVLAKRSIDTQLQTAAQDLQATREATQAAQMATERQLEASRRPLLIDVAPDGPVFADMGATRKEVFNPGRHVSEPVGPTFVVLSFPGEHLVAADPRELYVGQTPGYLHVMVPLRNAGNGLAVIDTDDIRATGAATRQLIGCDVKRERVPPGETTRIICTHTVANSEQPPDSEVYELAVPYRDFAGGQLTVALVRLEHFEGDVWRLYDVRQVEPDKLDPRLAPSN